MDSIPIRSRSLLFCFALLCSVCSAHEGFTEVRCFSERHSGLASCLFPVCGLDLELFIRFRLLEDCYIFFLIYIPLNPLIWSEVFRLSGQHVSRPQRSCERKSQTIDAQPREALLSFC